ncbi:PAAR domain-containing protein [Massilia sp. P8910]|uniref:PAAR domain-containing protein n=1 Tax=Massilia antarctica TaxID=2765360 RepID=UPI001E28BD2B|nr:PAAR domain-containing protein [Massilia antarctica]MCE3607229.1 PAAR domain-containing protein [Massilia antarctica]
MSQAARLGDPIGHSPTMNWLIAGAVAAATIAVVGVAIVGTGGLAAVAIIGGAAAGGAGIGEALSTMSFAPKEVCGKIAGPCSMNVFTNGRPAARAHLDMTACLKHPQAPLPIATGSATVFINGLPAARVDDTIACSAVITDGSANVFIGGGSVQTDAISPENLVPPALHAALLVVGVASAVILAGPVVAVAGLALGIGGGMAGGWVGGKIFGEGSDGQKWSALGGSLIGGLLGGKEGAALANRGLPRPVTPGWGFVKGGLPGMRAAGAAGAADAEAAAQALAEQTAAANRPPPPAPAPSVFDMRTPAAQTAADNVVAVMKGTVSPTKSPVVQVFTHENGTVSVGLSGDIAAPSTASRVAAVQAALDKKYGPGIYKVGTTTLNESNGIVRAVDADGNVIGNAPGVCAEPKASTAAAQNQSPINGSATVWRGKGPNPHTYTGDKAGSLSGDQMNPCATCGTPHNQGIYNNAANGGGNVE